MNTMGKTWYLLYVSTLPDCSEDCADNIGNITSIMFSS